MLLILLTACGRTPDEDDDRFSELPVIDTSFSEAITEAASAANDPQNDVDDITPSSNPIVLANVIGDAVPNWEADFSRDGFISLERFAWHVENAGSSFRMISTDPLEFSDGRYIISFDRQRVNIADMHSWAIFSTDRSIVHDDGVFGVSPVHLRGNFIDRTFALMLWTDFTTLSQMQDIGEFESSRAFWDARAPLQLDIRLSRLTLMQEIVNSYPRLTNHKSDSTSLIFSPWLTPGIDVSLYEFNEAIRDTGFNFEQVSPFLWSNGYIMVLVELNASGHVMVIVHDGDGSEIVIIDDTGWLAAKVETSMSQSLAHYLWWVLSNINTFTTMEQVLAQEILNDTLRAAMITMRGMETGR